MNRVVAIEPGFSTADAEYPALSLEAGVLHLTFKDWQERLVRVQFQEVCAFRWQEAEELYPDEPYDGSCEILQSEWLARHIEQGAIPKESGHHFRFNFNACGQLEVLCASFTVAFGGL